MGWRCHQPASTRGNPNLRVRDQDRFVLDPQRIDVISASRVLRSGGPGAVTGPAECTGMNPASSRRLRHAGWLPSARLRPPCDRAAQATGWCASVQTNLSPAPHRHRQALPGRSCGHHAPLCGRDRHVYFATPHPTSDSAERASRAAGYHTPPMIPHCGQFGSRLERGCSRINRRTYSSTRGRSGWTRARRRPTRSGLESNGGLVATPSVTCITRSGGWSAMALSEIRWRPCRT